MSGIAVATGCTLQVLSSVVVPVDQGWEEQLHVEVLADGAPCAWVSFALPSHASVAAVEGHLALGDGTRRRVGPERLERVTRDVAGLGALRVHTPDLLSGDRVILELERSWRGDEAFVWSPSPARFGELSTPPEVGIAAEGRLQEDPDGWWVQDPEPADRARLTTATLAGEPEASPTVEVARGVRTSVHLELRVPAGDPQLRLYPGGGSSVRTETVTRLGPAEVAQGWVLPLPRDRSDLTWTVTPSGAAEIVERDDSLLVVTAPSEAETRVVTSWVSPDAPTFGERGPELEELTVDAPGGLVVEEGDAWLLAAMHERPVLPAREALLRALDRRFREAAIPEPGLPLELRGLIPGWDAAAAVRDALWSRAAPLSVGADPLWPRRLVKARKTGVVSPLESALIAWVYAKQAGLQAEWVLARPADRGPGARTSPAGFDRPIVHLTFDGESRWMDPSCRVCAPFELPPELEGAAALSPALEQTPPPTPGLMSVDIVPEGARWHLEGPAALEVRRWLQGRPDRDAALAARIAGEGATLAKSDGLDEPGAWIDAAARGVATDPLDLGPPRPDGSRWLPWVGQRRVWREGRTGASYEGSSGALAWRGAVEGGGFVEVLEVRDRRVSADDAKAFAEARAAALASESVSEQPTEQAPTP